MRVGGRRANLTKIHRMASQRFSKTIIKIYLLYFSLASLLLNFINSLFSFFPFINSLPLERNLSPSFSRLRFIFSKSLATAEAQVPLPRCGLMAAFSQPVYSIHRSNTDSYGDSGRETLVLVTHAPTLTCLFTLLGVHGLCGLQSVFQGAEFMNEIPTHQISGRIWSPLVCLIQSVKSELLHTVEICVSLYLKRKVTELKQLITPGVGKNRRP